MSPDYPLTSTSWTATVSNPVRSSGTVSPLHVSGKLSYLVLVGSSPYGYTPSKGVCITAIVLFSISTALHTAQAIYYSIRRRKAARLAVEAGADNVGGERRGREPSYWWILVTLVPGGLLEIIGWAGRYWSSQNVLNIEVCGVSPYFIAR